MGGGCWMSNKEYSPIKLQLEEAIWLDHRAQNAEIVSLELIPEVDVLEDEFFVNIRGYLVLSGRFETEQEEEESLDLESSSLAEQLQFDPLHVQPKEIYQQEYRGKIKHRFPFDVTVPANKISNLNDVYVQVEQFDYTITDGHRLHIKTDISITGIESETEETSEGKTEKKEKVSGKNSLSPSLDVTAFRNNENKEPKQELKEVSKETETSKVWDDFLPPKEETKQEVKGQEEELIVELKEEVKEEPKAEIREEEPKEVIPAEKWQERLLPEETTIEASLEEQQEERPEVLGEEGTLKEADEAEEKVVPLITQEIKTTFNSKPEERERDSTEVSQSKDETEEEEVQGEGQTTNRTVSFLTKLMEHGNEGEEQTRTSQLRMCIIQHNESLEDISKRYSLSVYEIMKVNRLETDQTSKGQILYIPYSN